MAWQIEFCTQLDSKALIFGGWQRTTVCQNGNLTVDSLGGRARDMSGCEELLAALIDKRMAVTNAAGAECRCVLVEECHEVAPSAVVA